MSKKLFALVKWLDREGNGDYTAGVPVEWIHGFDYEKYQDEDFDPDESWVIEWHEGKKPKGGWRCYDGLVIDVAHKISTLEKKLDVMNVPKEPRNVPTPSESTDSPTIVSKKSVEKPRSSKEKLSKRKASSENDPGEKRPRVVDLQIAGSNAENEQESEAALDLPSKCNQHTDDLSDIEEELSKYESNVSVVRTSVTLQDVMNEVVQTKKLVNELLEKSKTADKAFESAKTRGDESENNMVEFGNPGSKVFIPERKLKIAKSKPTYTSMGLSLLVALFPMDVLLRSNLKGGRSKLPRADGTYTQYEALDKKIISALKEAVEMMHPATYNETMLGMAINTKLSALRSENAGDSKTPQKKIINKTSLATSGNEDPAD